MKTLLLIFIASMAFAKKNVCTITINSTQEKEVFQSKLGKEKFNFIELTDYSSDKAKKSDDWFQNACNEKVTCDVLVVSGHFGGSFFGSTGLSLGLNELEKNSCQSKCAGILEQPKEVFLFGCNTLASKEQDHRTPQEYFTALVEHDVDATEAERIVAARYSPIGSSFKDRMERVFEGVPFIYGFSSVGPSGKNIKPSLVKYFDAIGDYSQHLQNIESGKATSKIFERNMTAYATHVTSGMKKANPAYVVKENSCKLSDENVPLENRVSFAGEILESSPFLYFPTVSNFISTAFGSFDYYEETESEELKQNLVRIMAKTELKDQISKIEKLGGFGPTMQMDLLNFGRTVRWYTAEEYEKKTKELYFSLMEKPTFENKDTLCSLLGEDNAPELKLTINDLPKKFDFLNVHALGMLSCIKTDDQRITYEVIKSVSQIELMKIPSKHRVSVYAALGLLPGYEEYITNYFSKVSVPKGNGQKDENLAVKALLVRKAQGPQLKDLYLKFSEEAKNTKDSGFELFLKVMLGSNKYHDEQLELQVLKQTLEECSKDSTSSEKCYTGYFWGGEAAQKFVHDNFVEIEKTQTYLYYILAEVYARKIKLNKNLEEKIFDALLKTKQDTQLIYMLPLLGAEFDLSLVQILKVKVLKVTIPQDNAVFYALKHILFVNKDKFSEINEDDVSGHKLKAICKKDMLTLECEVKYYQ